MCEKDIGIPNSYFECKKYIPANLKSHLRTSSYGSHSTHIDVAAQPRCRQRRDRLAAGPWLKHGSTGTATGLVIAEHSAIDDHSSDGGRRVIIDHSSEGGGRVPVSRRRSQSDALGARDLVLVRGRACDAAAAPGACQGGLVGKLAVRPGAEACGGGQGWHGESGTAMSIMCARLLGRSRASRELDADVLREGCTFQLTATTNGCGLVLNS